MKNGGLVSLPASGVPFTWTNGHKDNNLIFERLDRALANAVWLNLCPNASLHNYPIFGSNHSSILLDCHPNNHCNIVGRRDFKFLAKCLNHPDFTNVVKRAWCLEVESNPNNKLRGCLRALKTLIKGWNKEVFGDVHERVGVLFDELKVIQAQNMEDPNNVQLLAKEAKLRNELNRVLKNEEILWAQKARVNWLELGDKNTKFFQTMTNIKRKRNEVLKIEDTACFWWLKREGMEQIFVQDFKLRFTGHSNSNNNMTSNFISIIDICNSED